MAETTKLKRSLSLGLILFYGLGTILGAGIYVLISEVAAKAGYYAPAAFVVAAVVAGFTAFTFAEMASRYPVSAGEAVYVSSAFPQPWLAVAVGLAVVLTGVVSASTIINGFVGYLDVFIQLPRAGVIIAVTLTLGGLACWGISQSVWTATVITLAEIGGLLFVLTLAGGSLANLPSIIDRLPPLDTTTLQGVGLGAFLAFYAFIGFEDMVNVAEEVKDPHRNLPRAIVICLILSTALYLMVALVAVTAIPLQQLQQSTAPMADILAAKSDQARWIISVISMVAVINGALIQMIMASRVLYGMASKGWLTAAFSRVNPYTQTPLLATVTVTAVVLFFSLWLTISTLAQATSFIILLIFSLVNAALIKIKWRENPQQRQSFVRSYPLYVPVCGLGLCLLFLGFKSYQLLGA